MITCHAGYKPGARQQLDAILSECGRMPTIAGEACSFPGYVTRIAAGLGVGLADRGHTESLRREDIVSIPLVDVVCIRTYVLHKHQRFGLPEAVQRFLTHAKALH